MGCGAGMIVTLTANPSVDRTIEVATLRPGTVIRARASRVDAGGKGVTLTDAAARADWVVLCGSLSPGAPAGWYAELIRQLRGTGPRVAIDSSGPPLAMAIAARPDLIKPNRDELAELAGRPIDTIADVVGAALTLTASGVHSVLASLGPAGAVLVRRDAAWHATAAALEPRSTCPGRATSATPASALPT
jgi:fructose-1-phosphate kinase PfkB-like protein